MNATQIARLLAGVPAGAGERHMRRAERYAGAARLCDERIAVRRAALEGALRRVDDPAGAGDGDDAADELYAQGLIATAS
jgi:hypothetical protein